MNIQHFYRPEEAIQSDPLHYTDCGLDNIYLSNGFEIEEIDGEQTLSVANLDGLHAAIGLHIVLERKAPSPKELRFLRNELDMSQAELAQVLGVSDQTVARWEKGQCDANGAGVFGLRMIYLLSLTPERDRDALLNNILERLKRLTERDETDDNITLTYFGQKWHSPKLHAA
ncbi:helix-turn-helix domain-containing protein [Oricola sp.]|uniref:helix-turn-helix domain-containing protein n=1 Tax=Oricola sp. TaxID=1979950 RepID=UPI003BA85996